MANNEVYMNVPIVRGFAKTLGELSNVLNNVSKVLDAALTLLKTTAFIGAVGGAAIIHMIETVKPPIDKMAKLCEQLGHDVDAAATKFETGDAKIATPFG
jgi:hypothetical protein